MTILNFDQSYEHPSQNPPPPFGHLIDPATLRSIRVYKEDIEALAARVTPYGGLAVRLIQLRITLGGQPTVHYYIGFSVVSDETNELLEEEWILLGCPPGDRLTTKEVTICEDQDDVERLIQSFTISVIDTEERITAV